jgi:hypothetical protein
VPESIETFIESLGIPEACFLGKKIPKSQFYTLGKMNTAQQKSFAVQVDSITWTHTLKKSTINIAPLVTEQIEYIEIAFVRVVLHEKGSCRKIAEVIQAIPYPVVLFMSYGTDLCINVAKKRINQADTSKLTTDEYLYTDWIDLSHPDDAQKAFLESLKLSHLSFENFYTFYADIASRIIALEAASLGAEFSTDGTSQKKSIVDKINKLKEQILSLRNSIKKESQFNAKVRLNLQVKNLLAEIETLKNNL